MNTNLTSLIKKLRELTQAGFMDCKKALEATATKVADFDTHLAAAVKWLREHGMAKAASKNADKVAAEGLTLAGSDEHGVALLELNTQTDFTGKSTPIITLAQEILAVLLKEKPQNLATALTLKLPHGNTVQEACLTASATTGEKVELRRITYCHLNPDQGVGVYVHNNYRISAVVIFDKQADCEKLKNVAMHLTAMNPKFLNQSQVDATWLVNEQEILATQLAQEDKPQEFMTKIIEGRIKKLLAEVCLVSQPFILDANQTVGEFIASLGVVATTMIRYELGEGIKKVEVDFASEVAAQMR